MSSSVFHLSSFVFQSNVQLNPLERVVPAIILSKMKKITTPFSLPLLAFLCFQTTLFAQAPNIQDCLGAIPVCQQIYVEDQAPVGDGNIHDEIQGTCMDGEKNVTWYSFTVNQTGDFGFVLTPNDPNDDYDWALFDITNASCGDIPNDPSLVVSCNAAGNTECHGPTGATGDSNYNIQGAGCGFFPPTQAFGMSPFNALVPVQQGNTYVLAVSNWTGSPNGYSIDFGLSTGIGILDEEKPFVADILPPQDCGAESMLVTFSESIQCNSIGAINFVLNGPGGPYSLSVAADDCDIGGFADKEFVLTINPPINEPGDFALNVVSTDNQVLDVCNNSADFQTLNFVIDDPGFVNIDLGQDLSLCEGDSITLDVTTPNATYLWQDGSTSPTFTATESGIYSVTVMNDCNQDSDEIQITFSNDAPIFDLGNDTTLCEGDALTLSLALPNATFEWQDGSTNAFMEVTQAGLYSVLVSTDCGEAFDEIEVLFKDNLPQVNLGADTSLCNGETLMLDASFANATFQWQDGSTNSALEVANPGLYSVTVSNECGSAEDALEIAFKPPIEIELGKDTFLCPGETLQLKATVNQSVDFLWPDFSSKPTFLATQAGTYRVNVSNGCEQASAEIALLECTICKLYFPNVFSPNLDGINDFFQAYSNCPFEKFNMKIFNRWGVLVFESTDVNVGWDGTFHGRAADMGVYVWFLEYTVLENGQPRTELSRGDVAVLK